MCNSLLSKPEFTDYISENISTDESVPCFYFTEESVNSSREHIF